MSDIFTIILIVIMAIMGGLSTLYIVVSLPAVIIWKLIRLAKGYKLTD